MAKADASKPLNFTVKLSLADAIDDDKGRLQGVVVAEVGEATGHFVCLDKAGLVIGCDDDTLPGTVRILPLFMDEKGLGLVVEAGVAANRAKARENHDDSVGSRAGYVDNFRLQGGKAVCDLNIWDAYRHRALFLETALKTPEMIGLSGDFRFLAEIIGDRAYMRVTGIDAVDIVDQGALTHAGLFSKRGESPLAPNAKRHEVDKANKVVAKKITVANAPKIPPAGEGHPNKDSSDEIDQPDMEAFKAMCEQVGAYAKHIEGNNTDFASHLAECTAHIAPVTVPTPDGAPAPVHARPSNPDAAVKDPAAAFAAIKAELSAMETRLKSGIGAQVELGLKKQMSALGIKPAAAPAPTAPADVPPLKTDEPKTFHQLRAKIAKDRNLKPGAASQAAMKENPELYRTYLKSMGVYDPAKDPRNRAA